MPDYSALGRHLSNCDEYQVGMTFQEVERITGDLPRSARSHRAWWSNHPGSQSRAWLNAGYKVQAVSLDEARVQFTRVNPVTPCRPDMRHEDKDLSTKDVPVQGVLRSYSLPQAGAARNWASEASVSSAIASHLVRKGWRILRVADTESREQGIDIVAERDGRRCLVETKGYPINENYTQARHYFSDALRKVLLMRQEEPEAVVAFGFPRFRAFETGFTQLRPTLTALRISVFWVEGPDTVTEEHEATPA